MGNDTLHTASKFLSYVLRHKPGCIGLTLGSQGRVDIDELILCAYRHEVLLTRDLICEVVAKNNKKRFVLDGLQQRIRAQQGHSIAIDLGLEAKQPPEILYHGTATRFLSSIRSEGLKAGSRQHVHLSSNVETATAVGQRHGKTVVLVIKAEEMAGQGNHFYLSGNGVWLCAYIPSQFIDFGTN